MLPALMHSISDRRGGLRLDTDRARITAEECGWFARGAPRVQNCRVAVASARLRRRIEREFPEPGAANGIEVDGELFWRRSHP